jgi:isopenicillin N synthase-like dioxygenase
MNQKVFIEESDDMLNNMTTDELKSCLHNVARKMPENKRQAFI